MKRATLYLALLCIVVIAVASHVTAETRNAKARYYYLAASEKESNRKFAEAYELYKRAYDLDTNYAEAAYSVGETRLGMNVDEYQTLKGLFGSADLMKKYIEENPMDYSSAIYYAYVMSALGDESAALDVYERLDTLFGGKEDLLYRLAESYVKTDSNALRGIAVLDRLEKMEGISPKLSVQKMIFHFQDNDTIGALKECEALVNARPNDPMSWMVRGNVYGMINQSDSMLTSLLRAESLDPESGTTKLSIARYYGAQGDSVAYDNKMYEALMCDDLMPEDKVEALAEYLQTLITDSADTSRGDALFNVINQQMPFEPSLIELSSRYNAAKGDFVAAEEDAQRVLALDPDNMEMWSRLFSYMAMQKEFDKVMPEFLRARSLTKLSEGAVLMAGSALIMDKRYDEALDVYNTLITDAYPDFPTDAPLSDENLDALNRFTTLERYQLSVYYNLIGDVYQQKNLLDSTYMIYDNALTVFEDNPSVLNNYAYFLSIYGGDLDDAYKKASKAIKLEDNNPTYLDTYAWVLFKKKEYLQAKVYQSMAIDLSEKEGSESSDLYDHMGDILFFLEGNADEAIKYWEKALEMDNENVTLQKKVEHKTYFNE